MEQHQGYWFYLEPYVFPVCQEDQVLLYNTLDSNTIESHDIIICNLLKDLLNKSNAGVIFLSDELYQMEIVRKFVCHVRDKFMGDLIDVKCSTNKPVQILPYIYYSEHEDLRTKFLQVDNILNLLFEIHIKIGQDSDISAYCSFLMPISKQIPFTIILDKNVPNQIGQLLEFVRKISTKVSMSCPYQDIAGIAHILNFEFVYNVSVNFPIDQTALSRACEILHDHHCKYRLIFHVASESDVEEVMHAVLCLGIEDYSLKPIYTKDNYSFFRTHVFLSREDILSTQISMKELIKRHVINTNDFGKIYLSSKGDVYANRCHPPLGSVLKDDLYEVIRKEIMEGQSWLRVRNQGICATCMFQWLCPSPSDYEIEIGQPNLCLIK